MFDHCMLIISFLNENSVFNEIKQRDYLHGPTKDFAMQRVLVLLRSVRWSGAFPWESTSCKGFVF